MTKLKAINEIIVESRRDRGSLSGYKRLLRALRALDVGDEDRNNILCRLDYHDSVTDEPYAWLAAKLKGEK